MKNKSIGGILAAIAGVLAIVTLIMLLIYSGQGIKVQSTVYVAMVAAILCEAAAFVLGETVWTDFTSVIACVCLAFALMTVLQDGVWNIAAFVNNIKMEGGTPELGGMNMSLIVVNAIAMIAAIAASFMKKSKA